MNSFLVAAGSAHFLAGLALLTLAGIIGASRARTAERCVLAWVLTVLIALGLTEWCGIADADARALVCQWCRLVCEAIALVGLAELGRRCATGPRAGLLPRWSYAIVAGCVLAAALFAKLDLLEFALRLTICWQAGWLAANYLRSEKTSVADQARTPAIGPNTLAFRTIVGALLVNLVAACVAIPLLGMAAAFVAVAGAYWVFRPSPQASRQTKLLWRCTWPIGFVLLAAGGCYSLPTPGENESGMLLVEIEGPTGAKGAGELASAGSSDFEATDSNDDQMSGELEGAGINAAPMGQAKRVGLCISPIIVFVLLIWGLSRLPFVH